jgi:thiamine biosynthesis lipoprotein ApbE
MTAALIASLVLPQVVERTEVFLTEAAALKVIFGDARVERHAFTLPADVKERVERRLGRRVEESCTLFLGRRDGAICGYAMITEEIGKYLPITFIVGVDPRGSVIDVAVLVHREPIGADCAKGRFTAQLRGKTVEDPIRKDRDILVAKGATYSCDGVARGTRKVLAIVDELCLNRPGFAEGLQEETSRQQRYRMGALLTIEARGSGARAAVDAAFDEVKRLEGILSNYDDQAELSRLNREGRIRPSDDLRLFLESALRYARETGGAFDPTIGSAVRAWGFRTKEFRVPSDDELLRLEVGWRKVVFEEGAVRIPPKMELDPGAIGKGWAVDAAVRALREKGMMGGQVDFGSSIHVFGESRTVALRDPSREGAILGTVTLRDEALGISGSYEKFFEQGGRRYAHILDPRTRRPVEGVAQAAVLAATATEADVYSTAVFVEPKLAEGRPVHVVYDRPDRPALATPLWATRFKEK